MAQPVRIFDNVIELRCNGRMHGKLNLTNGLIEVKCSHWTCTRGRDIVFHYYDINTGDWVKDRRLQDPGRKF